MQKDFKQVFKLDLVEIVAVVLISVYDAVHLTDLEGVNVFSTSMYVWNLLV